MKNLIGAALICGIFLFSCQSRETKTDKHDHSGHNHAHDDHSGHDHANDDHSDHDHAHDDHSGHDHAHDDHAHDDHSGHDHEPEDGQVELSDQQFARLGLQVETVSSRAFSQVIKSAGQLEAATGQETIISARSNGVISFAAHNLTSGSPVGRGETLAYISDRNLVDGEVLNRQKLHLNQAEQEYQRAQQLMRDSLISVAGFNQARADYDAARLNYQTLASGASEQGISVSSSLSGYLKNLLVQEGSYVTAGQAIAVVTTLRKLRLRADLPESYAPQLPAIHSANIKTADGQTVYDLSTLNGRLVSYARALDPETHRLPVFFEFDNTGHLVAGAFVEVYLKTRDIEAITVPLEALIEEQGNHAVYIKEAPELYRKQAIQIGASDGSRVVVTAGLQPGTTIVTKGAYYLKLASMSSAIPHGHAH